MEEKFNEIKIKICLTALYQIGMSLDSVEPENKEAKKKKEFMLSGVQIVVENLVPILTAKNIKEISDYLGIEIKELEEMLEDKKNFH